MTKEERLRRVAGAVTVLAEAFQAKCTPDTIRAYEIGTRDIPVDVIEQACAAAIISQKWMPKVFELRTLCGVGAVGVTADDRALIAWKAVRRAISTEGAYRTVIFDDPIATATVRGLGGWVRICDTPSGESLDAWLQRDFLKLYAANCAAGIEAAETLALPGLDAISRRRADYDLPEPTMIAVGLPKISKNLIRGVIQEPAKLVALPDEEKDRFVKSLELPELDEKKPAREPEVPKSREQILKELSDFEAKRKARENPPILRIEDGGKKQGVERGKEKDETGNGRGRPGGGRQSGGDPATTGQLRGSTG